MQADPPGAFADLREALASWLQFVVFVFYQDSEEAKGYAFYHDIVRAVLRPRKDFKGASALGKYETIAELAVECTDPSGKHMTQTIHRRLFTL